MSTTTRPAAVLGSAPLPALLVRDRCDKCGAQAFVRARLAGGELLFCGHHARTYAPALAAAGAVVRDDTHLINVKPSQSANAD
ncbi:hypothetical protein EV189_2579 [Motilibacter rhizosphaerae]|uniref:DUF7455 domain-containing protein n=1 Tax=Motilibacter rhizosphaerae TaxID=598652 RepID=A0A4Q7NQ86_9ACTN|nr:hypothetical protein [Motilibacter rhizosphaerae]RZS87156.1 hypothetical protein EV189_2579 [Motilibacter rhizosphaerae]